MSKRSKNVFTTGALLAAACGAILVLAPAATHAQTWVADSPHTEINFLVKHFFTPVTGNFGDFGVGVGSWAATMVVGGEISIEILLEAHRR